MNEILFFGQNNYPILLKNEPNKIIKPIQFKFENENENENENEKQIKQISSGQFSIIFLFKNGKAIEYLNENDSKQNPSKIQIEENIQKVTVGSSNEAILTIEGNVFAKGEYINSENTNEFINISSLIEDTNDRIIEDIASGHNSIYLLTSNQNVYGIGDNEYGQLGFDSKTLDKTEKPILIMKNVSKIFSGIYFDHVFLLNSNQELFGCGFNEHGQLGLGESRKEETKIQKITKIQNIPKGKIIDIKSGNFHSIMLIENENENENPKRKLYSCGRSSFNGLGKDEDTCEFTELNLPLFENDDDILDFSEMKTNHIKRIPIQIELPELRFNEDIFNYHISCGYNNSFIYYSPFSNLEEDLIKLFERKEFCDISFKTKNGEIIEAHKLILKYRLNQNENQNQNQIEKLQEIISNKSIKESNQIFEMIYSNRIINPILYSEIKEIINLNEKIEETMKRIYLNENENENEKDFIIERKEKQYKFPKLILIMRSELYRGMFLSVTEDKSNKVTDYSELSNKSFQIFEYWIYSNQIKEGIQITKEIINEIKKGIDYFQLNQTYPNLFDLLIKKFNNQNQKRKKEKNKENLSLNFGIDKETLLGLTKFGGLSTQERLEEQGGVEGVITKLCVDPKIGLRLSETKSNFKKRREVFGTNQISNQSEKTFLSFFLDTLKDLSLLFLLFSSVVSLILGLKMKDSNKILIQEIIIFILVLVACLVITIKDYKKERKLSNLNQLNNFFEVSVLREVKKDQSAVINILSKDVNIGDIALLSPGVTIPGDGLVISANELEVDESQITGEPYSIEKDEKDNPVLYEGTQVTNGEGRMIVIGVGTNTQFGQIREYLQEKPEPTPLQLRISDIINLIEIIGLFSAGLALLVLLIPWIFKNISNPKGFISENYDEFFQIVLIVRNIFLISFPSGFSFITTISFGYSMKKLIKSNSLVRRLEACEKMGNVTTICCEKTGVLTEVKLDISSGYFFDQYFQEIPEVMDQKIINLLGEGMAMNSKVIWDGQTLVGNQIDGAIVSYLMAMKFPFFDFQKENKEKIVKEFPFSSSRKRMSTIFEKNGKHRIHMKGSPQVILERCSHYLDQNGNQHQLTEEKNQEIQNLIENMTNLGLRTLALAYKEWDKISNENLDEADDFEKDLVFFSVLGLSFPIRKGASNAIYECQRAGITVRMLTGTDIREASHFARKHGILSDGEVIEGKQLKEMSDEERKSIAPKLQVVARSSPSVKLILVKTLQELGEVVAVTGDGTGDAPALQQADVGFSMGIAGTDVAKESSDIVLLDDNFNSIVNAIISGRSVHDNINKFVQFQLTSNLVGILLSFVFVIFKKESPFNIFQIFWANSVIGNIAAFTIGQDPATNDILKQKPYPKTDSLFPKQMIHNILAQTVYQLFVLFFILYFGQSFLHYDISIPEQKLHLYTILFNSFVFCQLFNQINSRKIHDETKIFKGILQNTAFFISLILIVLIQLLVVNFGGKLFSTIPLSRSEWIISIAFSAFSIPFRYISLLIKIGNDSQLPKKSMKEKKED
ncbi:calcium-transporting atpase [Anaeramoeba ignava]|uniref:Calcium-transporting ATPase n=1 Tax=Anaeramoeba ignava TaxID=1746090 RepID=A0A9Q0L941_ANAIG|nr:calcium-transporting atpase [Anaeramoeba ignava]